MSDTAPTANDAGAAPALAEDASLLRRTGGRRIARNVGLNLFGALAPMVAAMVAIPYLVHRLGSERFGLLSLTWLVIGYFGFFDLGLSRALAQLVAERLGARRGSPP